MWQLASRSSTKARSTTFFCSKEIIEIGKEQLEMLRKAAVRDPLKRSRLCLHQHHNDKVQEMLIAICRSCYTRPHRQMKKNKSYKIVEGDLIVVFFDDSGKPIRKIEMGTNNSGKTFLYRFPSSQWHTVIPLSEIVFYVEAISGPLVKGETEFATWGPDETDLDEIKSFLKRIAI